MHKLIAIGARLSAPVTEIENDRIISVAKTVPKTNIASIAVFCANAQIPFLQ